MKISKTIIALALLMIGVGGAKATKKYASISLAVGATWNAETNTMGFTEVNGWQILLTGLPSANITAYTNIHATLSDMSDNIDNIRLRIKDNSNHYADYNLVAGENNVDLAALATANPSCDFSSIVDITIWSPTSAKEGQTVNGDNPASVVITDCYIEKPFVFAFDDTGKAIVDVTDLTATGCFSLNQQTGVLTNSYVAETNQDGSLQIVFPSAVDMSGVYGFKVNYTGTMVLGNIWLNWDFMFGNNVAGRNDIGSSMASKSSITNSITKWRWAAGSTTGDMTITSIEFYSSVISAYPGEEPPMSVLTNYHKDGDVYVTTGYTPAYRENETTGAAYYGVDWNGEKCQYYSDVEGYKAIRVYSAGDNTPRAMFFNSTADGQQPFYFTWNEKGYYELLLSSVYSTVNNYKLISIRPASGTSSSVYRICMVVENPIYDYVISGKGVMTNSVSDALADGNATSIDATGITAAIALPTTNPNCLITANEGMLTNANNVIVDGTCANLVLVDGYPFKAPDGFTATAATYTTTISDAGAGTLCLPFAAAIPTDVKAYTLEYSSGEKATATAVETTIPANTPVLLNGKGEKTFTGEDAAITANTENVAGALTGVFETGYVPAGSFVLQNQEDGIGFYKVVEEETISIKPFRAYLTAGGSSPSRVTIEYNNDPSGISAATVANGILRNEVFNLNGQRVTKPSKGVFVVNGKMVIIK